jgi:hypothetical protein
MGKNLSIVELVWNNIRSSFLQSTEEVQENGEKRPEKRKSHPEQGKRKEVQKEGNHASRWKTSITYNALKNAKQE